MPTESPCIRKTRRTMGLPLVPLMGQLESRTMFSAISSSLNASIAKLESSITLPVSTNVVHIGPSRSVKTLTAAKWPGKSDKPVTFSLDPGTYSLEGASSSREDVSIVAANPSHPRLRSGFHPRRAKNQLDRACTGSNPETALCPWVRITVKNVQNDRWQARRVPWQFFQREDRRREHQHDRRRRDLARQRWNQRTAQEHRHTWQGRRQRDLQLRSRRQDGRRR